MSGLEATVLKLSEVLNCNKYFRIDDDYFRKEYILNDKIIIMKGFKYLRELAFRITDFGAYSQTNFIEFENEGVLFLRNQDTKANYVNIGDNVFINEQIYEKLSLKLEENDIVIPRVGSLGNAAVIKKEYLPCSANQNLAQIKVHSNVVRPYYISTFLTCNLGLKQIHRNSTGNVQQWLNLETIGNLKIPNTSFNFQDLIEKIVLKAHIKLDQSKSLYAEAETLLLRELGLDNWQPPQETATVKSFSDSFGKSERLDAEFYQPKYDEIEGKIRNYKGRYCNISDCFIQNKKGFSRKKEGYNYIEISDIDISDGKANYNFVFTEDLPANAKIKANKGDLLISKVRPYRGAVSIIDFDIKDLIVSGAFTVLTEKDNSLVKKETLKVLLRTFAYRELLLKYNCGSSYPVIKDEDVLNVEIPILPETIQIQITKIIKESFALRTESQRLLELAKQAVETAIEQGEAEAMNHIERKVNLWL